MQQYTLTLVSLLLVLGMTGCDIASDPDYVSWDEIKAKPKVPFLERDDSSDAQRMSEGFVKKILKAPSTAKFPRVSIKYPEEGVEIDKTGPQEYRVVSWVDSQNAFGAMIRTKYTIALEQISPNEWKPSEFFFDGKKIY